ncbi:MAG TPA: sigma-70 family RNA polymerase sigma factor [Candidatus Limnocylindrales bacterium]
MDDQALIAHLADDLDGAFEALVLSHQARLYSIARRLLADPRDAEEIAQDAFVRAYRALAGYDRERRLALQLRAWLATIVVNLSRNRARLRRHATLSVDAEGAPALVDPAPSPESAASWSDERRRWAALVDGLPPRYRLPVVLRHVDDLSYAEMAIALNRPEGTIKAQVNRGVAMLRAAYEAAERTSPSATGPSATGPPPPATAGAPAPMPLAPVLEVIR